jgi:hypothetical protein
MFGLACRGSRWSIINIADDVDTSIEPYAKPVKNAYQLERIGGQGKGVPGDVLRQLYQVCVIPVLTYGVQVWVHKC